MPGNSGNAGGQRPKDPGHGPGGVPPGPPDGVPPGPPNGVPPGPVDPPVPPTRRVGCDSADK